MTAYKARTRTEGDYGNSPQAAALRLQLAHLAALEATPTYQEMCAAADRTVAAGHGYLAQALAASPSPGRRSAVDGRDGDTGGAQGRRPLGSAGTVQAPPTSESGA